MGRRKKNKYRLVSDGLKIEKSLDAEWCNSVTDQQIIETVLAHMRFFSVLESYRSGSRKIELVPLRVHKEA